MSSNKFNQVTSDLSILLAADSEHRVARVGAIITDRKGKIGAAANNTTKTQPIQAKIAKTVGRLLCCQMHAEIAALVKCKFDVNATTIYIARVLKNGKSALAKPCPICDEAIKMTNIKNVFYTKDEDIC